MESEICILCDKTLLPTEKCIVKERAIESLIKASIKKKDKKHVQLRGMKELIIHKNCHTKYVRESSIKAARKAAIASTSESRRQSKKAREFDFSTLCFFCGEDATKTKFYANIKFKKSDKTRLNILEILNNRSLDNDFNKNLRARLTSVDNLVTAEGRYHSQCLSRFYVYRPTFEIGRPVSDSINSLMQYIILYILENDEECQFSLQEIIKEYEGEVPDIRSIKKSFGTAFWRYLFFYGTT